MAVLATHRPHNRLVLSRLPAAVFVSHSGAEMTNKATLEVEQLRAENEGLRKAAEWAYDRALRIAEPAYTEEGVIVAAKGIANRLRLALDTDRDDKPSSAGECAVCGRYVEKRYGGMGRYRAMCIDCWEADAE
jgi:hypothetical protein